jgi:ATP-dependent DNA helicase RecG
MFTNKYDILQTPIEYLKGVGPIKAALLKQELGISTFSDMLMHFPFRYINRSNLCTIHQLPDDGSIAQCIGTLQYAEVLGNGRSKRLVVTMKDATGSIELVWFQGIHPIEKIVEGGGQFLFFGKVTRFQGYLTMSHPEIEKLDAEALKNLPPFIPVYSSTEKLRNKWLSGKNYVKLVQQLWLQISEKDMQEILPLTLLQKYTLPNRFYALRWIHFPDTEANLQKAIHRLKFEELFIHQLSICKLKRNRQFVQGFIFSKVGDTFHQFYKNALPFQLTEDQKNVVREIRQDTQTGKQMNRLLQGDVGSGKTIVALLCMLLAKDNQFQSCLMAPTEILAQQHYISLKELMTNIPVEIGYLSGKTKSKERKELLAKLADGSLHIIIGTHALIEEAVIFKNLGLCIIDEQHRFGVAQRKKLWDKNTMPPHILVMTATPIPRTLAMTAYGDLDISVIKNLPPGRKPITTIHRPEIHRANVMEFIRHEISLGRQAYIVYPLIEESEKLDYENLLQGFEQVKSFFHAHQYNIAMVHGKQKPIEREQNMQSFVQGKAHILVATTVIEVGVNVPNASVMLIESAERFGLSQLHQLRGRVGRGADKSYCILLTTQKVSALGKLRMQTMVEESSGFAIAEKDLELRGPGEMDGTKQSGAAELKLADIIKDVALLELTRNEAIQLLLEDASLQLPENQGLKKCMLLRKDREIWSRIS